jgi:hypothetical protein
MLVQELAEMALRHLGVAAHDEPATAEQIAVAVRAYNAMMRGWTAHNRSYAHADASEADPVSVGAEYEDALMYALAARIAPSFQVGDPDPDETRRARAILSANFMVVPRATLDVPAYPDRRWFR